jgi:hypothetical protein
MKAIWIVVVVLAVAAAAAFAFLHRRGSHAPGTARVSYTFSFVAHGSYEKVFPLFGAEKERVWGGKDWDPHFIYPNPAADVEGAVFTIRHGHREVPWVNTAFDAKSGHVQYVYVIPEAMTTRIDIQVAPLDAASTQVAVTYERTALRASADEHVRSFGKHDINNSKEWGESIDKYLASAH